MITLQAGLFLTSFSSVSKAEISFLIHFTTFSFSVYFTTFFFEDFLKQYFTINILFSKDQDYGVLNFVMFCGGVYLRKVEKVLFSSYCMCNQANKIVPPRLLISLTSFF